MSCCTRKILLLAALMCSAGLSAQTLAEGPAALLESTASHIFEEVDKNLEEYTANPERLEALVRAELMPLIDTRYSARLILGRAGRGIEKEKINEFANTMSELLVSRYARGLLKFRSSEQLQVLPIRGQINDKFTRVRTRIKLPSGGFAPIDYAFHKTSDGWKAFDVIVEGISYVTTYRNQIMPEVMDKGIDSVIARLAKGDLELAE